MTDKEAIEEIEQSGLYGNQVHQKTLELALSALREKQEREKGCEFCNGDTFKSVGAKTIFDMRKVFLCGGDSMPEESERFKFCPMCGRELKEA